VSPYAERQLFPVELTVLEHLRPSITGRRVLEIGCGAGAISKELVQMAGSFVGIDVSPAMITYCARAIDGGTFLVGDGADLSAHPDGSYDAVVAGANVLDVFSHEERPAVMRGIRRVLADGGLFYVSAHNASSLRARRDAERGPALAFGGTPYGRVRSLGMYVRGQINHRRLARHQRFESDYAIINDSAHGWRLLHHYITRGAQERELEETGFALVGVWDTTGRRLDAADDDSANTALHYVARAT
jgi:SAM-dependent methyltransferase